MADAREELPEDGLPAPGQTPFKIETAEDLLSQPDPEWHVHDIVQRQTLVLIYGTSGCGKTFLAQDLAFHLALGRPWFERAIDDRAGVLYIAAEASGGTAKRVKALFQLHSLKKDTYCPIWFIRTPVDLLDLTTVEAMEITWAAWANQFEVMIFDTLSRCMPGGNENSPEDMTAAINTLDRIRERTGATIVVVHHTPLSDSNRPRGHSSLFAAADTAILVEQAGELRTAIVKYQRDGEEGARLAFRLKQVQTGQDKHCRPVSSCIVEPVEDVATKVEKPLTGRAKTAYDALIAVVDKRQRFSESDAEQPQSGTSMNVPVEDWREEFYRRVSEGRDIKRDSYRGTFSRARDKLKALGKIGFYDDQAWII